MSTSPQIPLAAEPQSDRPTNGRFTLGNKGGPGNPFNRQIAELRKLLLNTVPSERLEKIVLALVEKAEAGDVAAAKLVFQYTVGKPAAAVEPDRIELEDHRLRTESLVPVDGWGPTFGQLPVCTANKLWDGTAPEVEEETLLPFLACALEPEGATPEIRKKTARKMKRRLMRMLREGIAPSANGFIGRKIEEARRTFLGAPDQPKRRAKRSKAG